MTTGWIAESRKLRPFLLWRGKGSAPLVAWLGEEEGKPQPHSHPHYPPTHSCREGSRPRAFALAVLPPWKVFPTDTPWLPPFFPPFPSLGSNWTFSEWSSLPIPFNMASAVLLLHGGPPLSHLLLSLHHLFSWSVVSNSLWPHELQHARPPCPSLSPRVFSNSCPLSWWCHPTISFSATPPFPPAFNLSEHQGLSQWVSSLHQVAKVLEL